MVMHAVAVLRVPYADVVATLGKGDGTGEAPEGGTWVETGRGPRALAPLEDGALLFTEAPLSLEPDELGLLLRALLGDLAHAHGDERGILVVPDRALDGPTTYAAVIEAAGDLGDWIALPDEPAGGGLDAMMGQVAAMMGGNPEQMGGLWSQAQQLMADPTMQSRLMEAAQAVMGRMNEGQGLDFGLLAAQAREALANDPELLARMQPGPDDPGEDDDE